MFYYFTASKPCPDYESRILDSAKQNRDNPQFRGCYKVFIHQAHDTTTQILTNGRFSDILNKYAAKMAASKNRLLDAMSKEVEMKTITKRDIAVVQVISALVPDVAGITITQYTGDDSNIPDYKLAHVKVPGHNEIKVKLQRECQNDRVRWVPVWLVVSPKSNDKPGEVYSVLMGLGRGFRFKRRR